MARSRDKRALGASGRSSSSCCCCLAIGARRLRAPEPASSSASLAALVSRAVWLEPASSGRCKSRQPSPSDRQRRPKSALQTSQYASGFALELELELELELAAQRAEPEFKLGRPTKWKISFLSLSGWPTLVGFGLGSCGQAAAALPVCLLAGW